MSSPRSIFDPRYRPICAWWIVGLLLAGMVFIPSHSLWKRAEVIHDRNSALLRRVDPPAARDDFAIAWNNILSRRCAFWADNLGLLFGRLSITCVFIGQWIALRINEKPRLWFIWVVTAFMFASAGARIGGRWAYDSLSDEIDVARAREYTGHATRAEVSALHDRQSSVSRPWRDAQRICTGGLVISVGGILVEYYWARRRQRSRDGAVASLP